MPIKLPCVYETGGAYGMGRLLGSPVGDTDLTGFFGTVDALHPNATGHSGIDLGASYGQSIKAVLPGTVYAYGFDLSSAGYWVVTRHEEAGSPALHLMHAHMIAMCPLGWGQAINPGDELGRVGMTGLTTGPHLHWGAAPGDVNPYLAPGRVLWNPLDMLVKVAITPARIITYIGGGGLYLEEASEIAGARVVKILLPDDDNPGPTTTGT